MVEQGLTWGFIVIAGLGLFITAITAILIPIGKARDVTDMNMSLGGFINWRCARFGVDAGH